MMTTQRMVNECGRILLEADPYSGLLRNRLWHRARLRYEKWPALGDRRGAVFVSYL
jgi:hypothetical protein